MDITTPQAVEVSIVKDLQNRIAYANNLVSRDRVTKFDVKKLHRKIDSTLRKLYGAESEIIQKFRNVADGAILVSEPKTGLEELMQFASRILDVLTQGVLVNIQLPKGSKRTDGLNKLFVGHGRNPLWNRVVNHLKDELGVQVVSFETDSRASHHIVDILKEFLNECDAAVIVMTAEDITIEGNARTRQNVIHEIGLFQGRYDFSRVILFQQENTEDFSNIAGLQTVKFRDRVEEGFYELDRAIHKLQN